MTKFFKIKIGYQESDYIRIEEDELVPAMKCFLTNAKGVFRNGVCRGQDIIAITEDWHRAMGWNPGYRLTAEDFAEISRTIGPSYRGALADAKIKVLDAMQHPAIGGPGGGAG